jgi:hypothetical protein
VSSVREKPHQCERKTSPVKEEDLYKVCKQPNRGNLTYHSPLHSERGWG